jgi:hypothetical protein
MARQRLLQTACLALAFGALCGAANAQTVSPVSLINGNLFSAGGLTYTVSNCQYDHTTSCSAAQGNELEGIISSAGAEFEILNGTGSSVLNGGTLSDLSFTLTVAPTVSGSKTTVSSVSTSVTGTGTSSGVTVGFSVLWTSNGGGVVTATPGNAGGTPAVANFPAQSNFSISYDFAAAPGTTLTTTTTTLTPAPEPMTLAIMAPACLVLGRVKRRRKTRAASQA